MTKVSGSVAERIRFIAVRSLTENLFPPGWVPQQLLVTHDYTILKLSEDVGQLHSDQLLYKHGFALDIHDAVGHPFVAGVGRRAGLRRAAKRIPRPVETSF